MDLKKEKKGMSEVVSTLIMLVVAVLLAAVASFYGINTTTTRSTYEAVQFANEHIWCNSTGAVAAFQVQAVGGKDILIDKIEVRTIEVDWSNVYFYRVPTTSEINSDMNLTSSALLTGSSVTISGKLYNQATRDIELISGGEILFYIKDPGYIGIDDIGTTSNIKAYTNNAEYVTEINIESATNQ